DLNGSCGCTAGRIGYQRANSVTAVRIAVRVPVVGPACGAHGVSIWPAIDGNRDGGDLNAVGSRASDGRRAGDGGVVRRRRDRDLGRPATAFLGEGEAWQQRKSYDRQRKRITCQL